MVQRLTGENLGRILTGFTSGNYHPVVLLAYALEFRVFGMHPWGFHAVSLLLHLANTMLAFLLLRRLDGRLVVATAGAALFALHPMRVESVAWISDQKDLLAALFFLGALLAWLRWREPGRGSGRWYAASLVLFILACGAKGTMIVLPLMLLCLDLFRERKIKRDVLIRVAPFLAGSVIFGLVAVAARRSYEPILLEARYGPVQEFFFGAHRLIFYYLARTVWPFADRAALYPTLGDVGSSVPPGLIPAALLALGLIGTLVVAARRAPTVAFGLAFFLLGLGPSLTLPNLGYSADRFSYLPSIGLALAAGIGVAALAGRRRMGAPAAASAGSSAPGSAGAPAGERVSSGGSARTAGATALAVPPRGTLSWVVAIPFLALFAVASARQCAVWKDDVSLWTDAIAAFPSTPDAGFNRAMAHVYRGDAFAKRLEWDEAVADYTAALDIRSDVPEAWLGRAFAYELVGRKELALADFDRLLALTPDDREAILHAAKLRFERGDYAESLRLSLRAEKLGARVNPEVMEILRAKVGGGQ